MDKVLDRVIGPPPEELRVHDAGRDTIFSIKTAKNKIFNENLALKQQMSDMQRIMEKTSGENSKLRTHIKVLIDDHNGFSPTRGQIRFNVRHGARS
jgi:hypothetical protein